MSSIRLFLLDALAREEMHGHQLRHLAELERVPLWTDISVGGLYGALKRLAAEGLIEERRTEQIGGYPERQVWGVTDAGHASLATLREQGLREVVFRPDPVDLAIARFDPARFAEMAEILQARVEELRNLLADAQRQASSAAPYVSPLEAAVIGHRPARLRAEIAWHEQLLAELPRLLAAETNREDRTDA